MGLWYPEILNRLGSTMVEDSVTVCEVIDASIDQSHLNVTSSVRKDLNCLQQNSLFICSLSSLGLQRSDKYKKLHRHYNLRFSTHRRIYCYGFRYQSNWA